MSKKDFKGGLDSLLQDTREKKPVPKHVKRGRPRTNLKTITKSSQEGTVEGETRATFIVGEELLEKIKAVAYWERKMIKEVISEALIGYLAEKGEGFLNKVIEEYKKRGNKNECND